MSIKSTTFNISRIGSFKEDELGQISAIHQNEDGTYRMVASGKTYLGRVIKYNDNYSFATINIDGFEFEVQLKDSLDLLVDELGFNQPKLVSLTEFNAPMPGLVLDILVKAGDQVVSGDNLVVLEAMKMENILKATGSGIVDKIAVAKGDKVDKSQLLLKFK